MTTTPITHLAILLLILVNVVWYGAKLFLRSHGVCVGWLRRHFRDFSSLKNLAVDGESRAVRRAAGAWLVALSLSQVVFAVAAYLLFTSISYRPVP